MTALTQAFNHKTYNLTRPLAHRYLIGMPKLTNRHSFHLDKSSLSSHLSKTFINRAKLALCLPSSMACSHCFFTYTVHSQTASGHIPRLSRRYLLPLDVANHATIFNLLECIITTICKCFDDFGSRRTNISREAQTYTQCNAITYSHTRLSHSCTRQVNHSLLLTSTTYGSTSFRYLQCYFLPQTAFVYRELDLE